MKGTSLKPDTDLEVTPRPSVPSGENPFLQAPKLAPKQPTGTNPFLQAPEKQGSLIQQPQVLPTQARAPGPVNAALLGDNPIDAALNAQIANRT
jgi:hypothetical protein